MTKICKALCQEHPWLLLSLTIMSKGCVPTQVTNGKTKGEAGPQQIKDPQWLAAKSISCPGGQLSSFLRMQTHLCYRDAAPADLQPETVFSQSIRGSPSLTSSSERPLLTSPLGTSIFNHSPRPSPALFSTLSVHTGTFFICLVIYGLISPRDYQLQEGRQDLEWMNGWVVRLIIVIQTSTFLSAHWGN